jgi:hypothetical protein
VNLPLYRDARPIDSQPAWQEFTDWLPSMLDRLRDSPVYDRRNPAAEQRTRDLPL